MNYSNVLIRMASPNVPLGMSIEDDGYKSNGHCRMAGVVGGLFDIVILETKRLLPGSGCTIDQVEEVGSYDPVTGKYSGAIVDLQSGKFDCSFIPVFYPIIDNTDAIEYTRPIVEDKMEICSFYEMISDDEELHIKDILLMFDTIPPLLWILLAVSFAMFLFVFRLGFELIDRRTFDRISFCRNVPPKKLFVRRSELELDMAEAKTSNALWITVCAFLDQDNFPTNRKHVIVLSLFMSIGLFCAMAYLTNSVSTDLVVVKEPVTISTYDEIIERQIGVVSNKMFPERYKFYEQEHDRKEHKISQLFQDQKTDPSALGALSLKFFDQSLVVVARPLLTETTALFILGNNEHRTRIRALIVSDEESSRYTNVFTLRRDTNPLILDVVQRKITQLYESGIANEAYTKAAARVVPQTGADIKPSTVDKIHRKVHLAESVYYPVRIQNVVMFFISFGAMISFSSFILFAEHILNFIQNRFLKRKVRIRIIETEDGKLRRKREIF